MTSQEENWTPSEPLVEAPAAKKTAKKGKSNEPIEVLRIERSDFTACILGTSPLILNRMSEKAKRQLLLPPPRSTVATRQANLKHDPHQEYLDSPYVFPTGAPTLLGIPATAFKASISTAALDTPGTAKAQIGRLVYVRNDLVPVYGIPQLFMAVVRDAGINHSPDIRTRCIVPRWACVIDVSFATPILKAQTVVNLLASAGLTAGVGDWRPEKGKGSYGQFEVVDADHPEFVELMNAGRAEQEVAMQHHECYDLESTELLEWFDDEVKRRGFEARVPRRNGTAAPVEAEEAEVEAV